MATKRNIEVFSAGCELCTEAVSLVNSIACPSCEITVQDMSDPQVAQRAKTLGVQRVPAVVVDGKLAGCCQDSGFDEQALRDAGIGQAIA